uniref:UDP-2,4-diacetamido-2,4, 6-trideoxy-beta-L-altropyranose hydrolase n=1 Tax=Polynucleobacter sp. TaxID=2029855 RepID=UPI0040481361
MNTNKIIFRVDASLDLGSGHVMRCLALAERLRENGARIIFVSRENHGNLCDLIYSKGHKLFRLGRSEPHQFDDRMKLTQWRKSFQIEDALETQYVLKEVGSIDLLIVDHYWLDATWECTIKPFVGRIMVIDDLANRKHDCHILIDQNANLSGEIRYSDLVPLHSVKLLGPNYALLRQEFSKARVGIRNYSGRVRRINIFFGGMDVTNETGKALVAIASLKRTDIFFDVVIGKKNPHIDVIRGMCSSLKNVELHIDVHNMADLMARADVGVGAGGGAMWERCCVGLPSVVISVADNQIEGCYAVARAGGILYLGNAERMNTSLLTSALELVCASPFLLQRMRDISLELVDGKGIDRIIKIIGSGKLNDRIITLRCATKTDCKSIYKWRNEKDTRKFSNSKDEITFDTHVRWFNSVLEDESRALLIAEIDKLPVGVLRYDRKDREVTISIYLVPMTSSNGIGTSIINQGTVWLADNWPDVNTILAEIEANNLKSMRAFEKAGFVGLHRMYVKKIGNNI